MSNVRQHHMQRWLASIWVVAAGLLACSREAPPQSQVSEWLTVSAEQYELRGKVYSSKESLVAGLRRLEPKPVSVTVRWVAQEGAASASSPLVAKAAEAQAALREASIQTPEFVVGNEIFWPASPGASGAR